MKFFVVSLLAALAVVSATPTGNTFMRRECQIGKCVAALGPTVVGCGAAIAEAGANPIADAGCLAGAVNAGVNTPEVCKGCGAEFKDKLPEPVQDAIDGAGDVVGDVVDDAKDALGDLF